MPCGPQRSATCNGSRSSCRRAACTFTASRTAFPAYIRSAVMRCGLSASYDASTLRTPTYSSPSAADQSAPSASTGSSSASARPPRCHSRSTHTCFAMPVGSSWPMMATTRGPCSTTSGTRTSSTRSGTPNWRRIASRTFGGADRGADKSLRPARLVSATYNSPHGAAPPSRHTVRSRPRRRWHLARLALPRADCRVGLQHQPVRGLGSVRRGGCWFYRPLDHFNRTASLRFQRCLDVFDHGLKLLVGQLLERIAVLDLVLAGN